MMRGLALLASVPCAASGLRVQVTDGDGAPLADAVVTLVSPDGSVEPPDSPAGRAVLAQRGHRFEPSVLPIRRGIWGDCR